MTRTIMIALPLRSLRLLALWRGALLIGVLLSLAAPVSAQQDVGRDRGHVPPPNERLHETLIKDVRVTTAVPSAAETQAIFGADLYASNIQPVWIQVENLSEANLFFLPVGLDPAYFTPIETGYRRQNRILNLNSSANRNIYDSSMRLRVEAGGVRSGYVFSRVDEGTKSFNVDVFGEDGRHYVMTFFVPVPGLRLDHYDVDWANLYNEDEIHEVDRDGLIKALESLPCCTTDESGEDTGDPLNIAVVGNLKDVYYAFMRAGWDETETIYRASLLKTLGSALTGSDYRYSPVSALYVFGRAQDAALQKARADIHQRNHLRLWMTPMRYQGVPVWIGQISRDIGVRFTWRTITTHKIDPDVDETREYLVEDLAYAQSLAGLGYVAGVGAAPYDQPRGNLTGDPYFTDGLRVVLFLSAQPADISEIQILDLGSRPD